MQWRDLRITRTQRLLVYLDKLEEQIPVPDARESANLVHLRKKMKTTLNKMRIFYNARFFFYALLYASIVFNFLGDMVTVEASTFLTRFASPIVILSSIIGTTISIAYILLFGRIGETYWEDARTLSTHMISIYAKYDTKGDFVDHENGEDNSNKENTKTI